VYVFLQAIELCAFRDNLHSSPVGLLVLRIAEILSCELPSVRVESLAPDSRHLLTETHRAKPTLKHHSPTNIARSQR
jgi:hypothetical protein